MCPLSQSLAKPYDIVLLLTNFSEFKFDHRFGCPFDRQVCMQTLAMFQNIFSPFKPNLSKIAQQSFIFDQFLRIEI